MGRPAVGEEVQYPSWLRGSEKRPAGFQCHASTPSSVRRRWEMDGRPAEAMARRLTGV